MKISTAVPLVVVAAVTLSTSAATVAAVRTAHAASVAGTLDANAHAMASYRDAAERTLDAAAALVTATADDPALAGLVAGDRTLAGAAAARIERVRASTALFANMFLTDRAGTLLASSPAAPVTGLGFLAWHRAALSASGPVTSDLHVSPVTRQPAVVVAVAVHGPNGVAGVWAGTFRPAALVELGATSEGDPRARYGLITDGNGLVVAHQAEPDFVRYQTDMSTNPAVRAALAGQSGRGRWRNPIDGEEKIGAYGPLRGHRWAAVFASPVDVALGPARRTAREAAALAGLVGICTGIVAWLLARRLVRPLGRLAEATESIAAGDLGGTVSARGATEIVALADDFNAMSAALAAKDAEVRRRIADVEAANVELDSFAYSVSHDLRAPLRAIDGFSAVLVEDHAAALPDDGLDAVGRIRGAARRMGSIIDDLLTLSRVSRAEITKTDVDLSALATEVAAEVRGDRAGAVDVDVAAGLTVAGDPHLLRVALVNLLDNAFKFSSRTPNPRIEVGRADAGGEPCLYVRDNGAGFDMAFAGNLFGPFQRLHDPAEFPGTGIGLATVQRIVHRHGGRVWAEASPGAGATFFLTFPTLGPAQIEPGLELQGAS